uniref:Uncharacterized protein n=1 Tax=Lepeophtheirus salmonis TaxID=72036 RepID=A0A0K2U3N3_LEPSM
MAEGQAHTTDVVPYHGVSVLADCGFEGLGVWMTDTSVLPLNLCPKRGREGVGIRAVGGQKCQERVIQWRRWISFIAGIKSGLSTLTRLLSPTFFIAFWTVWWEILRSLTWALMDLMGLICTVFFNSSESNMAFLTDSFFLTNVSDRVDGSPGDAKLPGVQEWKFVAHVQVLFYRLLCKLESPCLFLLCN